MNNNTEEKYRVIKESDLNKLIHSDRDECFVIKSIPAQQLWDAALKYKEHESNIYIPGVSPDNYNDFLTEQFDK